jgi:methylenetetrahydrofolate dehydrogenase (NADP+) / methenyltetrahydrofolate cyclohydrolase
MKILSGADVAHTLEQRLREDVAALRQQGCLPTLAVLLVGENPASQSYVRAKLVAAERLGIRTRNVELPVTATQPELIAKVRELNADAEVHGILCQLPLPDAVDADAVVQAIEPLKDVDGLTAESMGLMALGAPRFVPCTPAGILQMLRHYDLPVAGRIAVVIGRSNIVGRPLSILLSQRDWNATVMLCHSKSPNLPDWTRRADLVVAAVGIPEFVTGDMVREGAVVVDVGVNRVADPAKPKGYRLCGDVKYADVAPKTMAITPVPGGVGPMTVTMLMDNTVKAARLQRAMAS